MQHMQLGKTYRNNWTKIRVFHCFPMTKRRALGISVENLKKSVKIVEFIHSFFHSSGFIVDKSTDKRSVLVNSVNGPSFLT